MTLLIREATGDDFDSLHHLNSDSLGYDYPKGKTRDRLDRILQDEKAKVLVAEMNGAIVGYIHAVEYGCTYADALVNLLAIAVDERFRRKGVARALLSAIENWAKESGATGIRLSSGMNRATAHKFYESCGYLCRKEQKNYKKLFK